MKNPSPDTSSPVGDTAAFGTTRTVTGTPSNRYNDPPNGTPATGTFTFTAFGIGSRLPTTRLADPDGLGDGDAVGDGACALPPPPPPPPLEIGALTTSVPLVYEGLYVFEAPPEQRVT
jgi:hypothetical protein